MLKKCFLDIYRNFLFKFIVDPTFCARVITNARFIQSNNKIDILIDNISLINGLLFNKHLK